MDQESLKNLVKQLDVNKDGKMTRDEVPERLQGQFDLISGGKDSVTVEQLQKMLSRFRRRGAGLIKRQLTPIDHLVGSVGTRASDNARP